MNMRILVVKCGALGDVVRTAYILPGLLKKYPGAEIAWLTARNAVDLLRHNPFIHRLISTTDNLDPLFAERFDIVISLDDEFEVLDILRSVRCTTLIGAFLDDRGVRTYDERSREWFDMGLISRYGKERADELKKLNTREHNQIFASMLGIEIDRPVFFNAPDREKDASRQFHEGYFHIGINSGAGGRWPSKQLVITETIELVRRLLATTVEGKETRIYLLGGHEERERHATIRSACPGERVIDTGNENSLLQFAAIIKQCDYVISSDSLSLHLAISQGVRNLGFFAPTSAAEIGQFGTGVKIPSLSADYCSYRRDADTSTITAERIYSAFVMHTGAGHRSAAAKVHALGD